LKAKLGFITENVKKSCQETEKGKNHFVCKRSPGAYS